MNELQIQPSVPQDLTALQEVIAQTQLFPAEMLPAMMAPFWEQADSTDQWLTCFWRQEIVGVAYFAPERLTQGTWNLYLIAIQPEVQGQGIGKRLMQEVEAQLRQQGQRILLVETSGLAEFAYQRQFYRRLGYEQEAVIREFYEPGNDKVVFWKRL